MVGESETQTCASACALIFLAGVERFSEGKLIVHQYLPTAGQGDAKVTWDAAFIGVQSMIGEIITLLNSLGTSPFVFERVFTSPDLYHVGKGINGTNGAMFIDVIVKVFRQQHRLLVV